MSDSSQNRSATELAAQVAAQNIARPLFIEQLPHAIVPDGYTLKNLERVLEVPKRNRGDFAVATAEAFDRVVDLYRKRAVVTLPIFFSRSGMQAKVQAVLNHEDWRDLTVTLTQRLSDPFKEWFAKNAVPQAQRAFALFLEERTAHVVKPDGAALLELARKFKANVQVRYQSFVENDNGDGSLEFMQTSEAGSAAAKSRMKVPSFITLQLPVWHGGDPVKFEARFGYSISDDGKLALSFEILQLEQLLTDELRKIVEQIGRRQSGAVVIEGDNAPISPL